ncbi:hypothetical protein [Kordiimonas sp. SCSIO 12610]|uniref:hypothetical protein n=1 Tax=Kordiimonas sp. SCSIO 12610 TaxID=2829597 RepID=UPI00210F0DF5|nr:hypothetical protein [Kordiimonas sp. SCSIO 12610]UTW56504.1 hypothetical protein KFF44_06275 [Kordiimonas sp. SCSIO 12610]
MANDTANDPAQIAETLATAIKSGADWPEFNLSCNLDTAYDLQHKVTNKVSDVGGIKAGVTAEPVQQYLGLKHALIGSLYANAQLDSSCNIPYIEKRIIECEVAVRADHTGKPVSIAPAIEFVRLCFTRQEDLNASNLVISNMGTEKFIIGTFIPWEDDFNSSSITLFKNDEIVNQAMTSQALEGPQNGVSWMLGEAQKRGHKVTQNTLFMTGACGATPAADKGSYRADFGALGNIEFSIT